MISRRNIRLKAMQILYAHTQDSEKPLARLEKSLLENINGFYRAYIYNLYLLCKTCEYALTDEQIQKSKHLPSQASPPANTQLYYNPIIQHLVTIENIFAFTPPQCLRPRAMRVGARHCGVRFHYSHDSLFLTTLVSPYKISLTSSTG